MEKVELIFGDCLDEMKKIPKNSVDLILCDLPYGTTKCSWDVPIPFDLLWMHYKRLIKKNGVICLNGCQPFTSLLIVSNLKMFKYCWVWVKERPVNILQIKKRAGKNTEDVVVFYEGQCIYNAQKIKHDGKLRTNSIKNGSLGVLVDSANKKASSYRDDRTRWPLQTLYITRDILKSNLHPTQKPEELCEYMIKTYTNEGDLVLDNCMGSGTSGVAAVHLKRRFIGMENNEKFFNIAKERIINESLKFNI
ncbi:MAG: site-specific DNA-methyltransferase [Patescibacteria group bacterium]|jgi:site-specific DNA-methyltransferase (adenine-specific)